MGKTGSATPAEHRTFAEELQGITTEPSVPEALRRALQVVDGLLRPRSSFFSVFDEQVQRLNVVVAKGRSDRRIVAAVPGEGPVGAAFTEGRIVRDGGLLAVPMLVGDAAIGTMTLIGGSWSREGLAPDDETHLRTIAGVAGSRIALAKAREEADRRSRELENAIERLEQRERVRDSILSHLSHELRTPLTTIKAYLDMALNGRLGPLGDRQRNAMEVSQRNADRLLRLINDLLLTARLEFGKMTLDPKALGLRSVLAEATELLRDDVESAGVTVAIDAPEGEVFVRGNRDRLVEGFMHLLERGLQAPRVGAKVRIEVVPEERSGTVRIVHGGLHLGPGELDGLFRAFRPEGGQSNLGLSIAKQVFSLHGGGIRAEATDEGLEFVVSFPLFAGAVATGARSPTPRQGEILVVEDDDDCRNGIVEYLSAERFEVRAYSDGQLALERIREVPPALLLVDLRIPGVDGAKLIQEVREGAGPSTPIYVISGAIDSPSGREEAWGARVDGVFEKPINFPYLLERVREYVAPR